MKIKTEIINSIFIITCDGPSLDASLAQEFLRWKPKNFGMRCVILQKCSVECELKHQVWKCSQECPILRFTLVQCGFCEPQAVDGSYSNGCQYR